MTQNHTYETLYSETIPSVVSLYVLHGGRYNGSGSGFVYDARDGRGYIVTNQHVVTTAPEVDIRFSEGDWRVGTVVGTDAYTDLAVVEVTDLPDYANPLPIASTNPRPGQYVAALGNPMGLEGSISAGVVSGSNRSMITQDGFSIPDTVQTDAPINPGNSGGPLVTLAGEVVGVNRARGGDNIGFAISAEIINRVVPELIEHGEFNHSYLKVRTIDVSPTIAEANDLDHPEGVLVADVSLGPASGALVGCHGTKEVRGQEVPVGGDIIVGVNGHPIRAHEELMRYLILETRPEEPLTVEIIRDGERLTETLTLGTRPKPARRISVA
ncbi:MULTISPECIES: S1C family serine protease [unclassified Haladaptatus]|uniref:S1C family serine protease n=1 Tax=unclassified Haladaptatus TaxID=2622732 RepID=UPI0023E7989B|nr:MULTISPECIES: trypsin-like peptidase domain-containing protein [unclassified Haladaptatus]